MFTPPPTARSVDSSPPGRGSRRTARLPLPPGALALIALAGCGSPPTPGPEGRLPLFVSILPQADFVERLGGRRVDVHVLVGPGQSHHAYEPTALQVGRLARAKAYFRIGVPFETGLLDKIAAAVPHLRIVDTSEGIRLRDATDGHDHDDAGCDHASHAGKDPHIWLDPRLVKVQAATICRALCELDPPHCDEFQANLQAFHAELDRLHEDISRLLAPLRGREFYVFHPAYGYFADAYGLTQVAVEEEGKEPSLRRLQGLIDRARRAGVRLIFVQPQFPTAGARAVAAAIGGAVVPMDPMARDYLASLRSMARLVADGLAGAGVAAQNGPLPATRTGGTE
jgi:zinc transport system substrate-binding protein